MEIRWITASGVKHLPEADLADTAARSDGVIWVHLDHSDEQGMALLVEMINPRRDDLRDVKNRTPVPSSTCSASTRRSCVSTRNDCR